MILLTYSTLTLEGRLCWVQSRMPFPVSFSDRRSARRLAKVVVEELNLVVKNQRREEVVEVVVGEGRGVYKGEGVPWGGGKGRWRGVLAGLPVRVGAAAARPVSWKETTRGKGRPAAGLRPSYPLRIFL